MTTRRLNFCCGPAIAGLLAGPMWAAYPAGPQIADRYAPGAISVRLADVAAVPKSSVPGAAQVARVNFLRSEPVAALAGQRLFANDMNGNLYVVDRTTNAFSSYLNFPSIFNGSAGTGVFDANPGYAAGVVTFAFDPDYAANGKFYSIHTELGSNPTEYREAVLTEWADDNIQDAQFAGTRATLMRVQYNDNIHPLGDLTFNPQAQDASHPDWRKLYISNGDGGAGEQTSGIRHQPQMLNNVLGKVLRIAPSPAGTSSSYDIPLDNPFVASPAGARGEIYAYGFRNPHRMSWDVDPTNGTSRLIVNDIGLHAYEEVNIVHAGANYGYSPIEGNQVLGTNNQVNNNPLPTSLPILVQSSTTPIGTIQPTYPVAMYSHRDGDAISSGFVYRGEKIKALRGKYIFGDIANGRLFWTDYAQMIAADDGDPATVAVVHELNLFFDSAFDADGPESRRVFDIVRDAYDRRNEAGIGTMAFTGVADNDNLPGGAATTGGSDPYGVPYGGGRSDVRLALIDNELYLLSKSDGMIRSIESADGDTNLDGLVDFDDLLTLAQHYGTSNAVDWFAGDFNFDGTVSFDDLLTLAQNYQGSSQTTGDAAFDEDWARAQFIVPEPTSAAMVLGISRLVRRRRADERSAVALNMTGDADA